MKLLYCYTKNTMIKDIFLGFMENGAEVVAHPNPIAPFALGEELENDVKAIETLAINEKCDGVLSWNYLPAISIACEKVGIPYIAWLFDSPIIHVYHKSMLNSCNYIFSFDKIQCEEIRAKGGNCYYMPLAVNDIRLGALEITDEEIAKYSADVSFVGALYTKGAYNSAMHLFSEDTIAKHNALFEKQYGDWTNNYLYTDITDEDVEIMSKAAPVKGLENYKYISKRDLYVGYLISNKMAVYERRGVLNELAKYFSVTLYTDDDTGELRNVECHPGIYYEEQVPKVYFSSKINLNLTLRSIKTGLPIRVFDITGVGGFLMSNYQKEFEDLYVPDKEVVLFSSIDELVDKTRFYLTHERERLIIAMNGYKRTLAEHTMKHRAAKILEIVYGLSV